MTFVSRFWRKPYKLIRRGKWLPWYHIEFQEDHLEPPITIFRSRDKADAMIFETMMNAAYNLGRQQGYRELGQVERFPA